VTDPLSDDRITLVGLLLESSTALRGHLDRRLAAEVGLPLQWFELLLRLARSPGHHLRMSDLAAQTSLTPSGLTRAVDRLEAARLVERTPCPSDRRGAYARLTDEGLARVTAALPSHLDHVDEYLTAVLTPEEQSDLAALLRKVRDHVNPAATAAIPVGPVA
jgi:DNA-binding MarR family transcriptional regulator